MVVERVRVRFFRRRENDEPFVPPCAVLDGQLPRIGDQGEEYGEGIDDECREREARDGADSTSFV